MRDRHSSARSHRSASQHAQLRLNHRLILDSPKKNVFRFCPDMVLALDHTAWIGPGRDMTEANVTRERAEERNPLADEHGQTTDDQAVYEPGTQELLNRDSTIHVETACTAS